MADVDLATDHRPLSWLDAGLCSQTDPEVFFPEKGASPKVAKRVCRSCEVQAECLQYALSNPPSRSPWRMSCHHLPRSSAVGVWRRR
ncbi:WhiB family transcriptional regulator [Nonomuraea sp. SYSU D8015]|uniref:WhiB family transcriptional regulator n=1 Tax=Nonomuraea sp. SYSU D8015 TaxID=2593644 RepID=UPI0016615A6E